MNRNETITHQLDHRSIRFFKDRPVAEEDLQAILAVGERTASSVGAQSVTVIRMTNQGLKDQLMKICGQEYVAEAPELFVFVVNLYRNFQLAKEKGADPHPPTMNHFMQGAADAHLMAQNMMNAIESLGLGGCFLGNILNDVDKEIELLDLPPYTLPILGMIFGHPDDDPQLKPRLDMAHRVHENGYEKADSYLDLVEDYDQEMTHYYDTRNKNQRSDSFSKQMASHMTTSSENRDRILKSIQKQGFDLGLDLEES